MTRDVATLAILHFTGNFYVINKHIAYSKRDRGSFVAAKALLILVYC